MSDVRQCALCGNTEYTMIEIPGVYDGALFLVCNDCGYAFHRFAIDHYLHTKAQPYINEWNEGGGESWLT